LADEIISRVNEIISSALEIFTSDLEIISSAFEIFNQGLKSENVMAGLICNAIRVRMNSLLKIALKDEISDFNRG
jgi:hypothetical protein